MKTAELRIKLIENFENIIQNDANLMALDGVFDALNTAETPLSTIPKEHYNLVEERRLKYIAKKTSATTWDEVKLNLKNKYGVFE